MFCFGSLSRQLLSIALSFAFVCNCYSTSLLLVSVGNHLHAMLYCLHVDNGWSMHVGSSKGQHPGTFLVPWRWVTYIVHTIQLHFRPSSWLELRNKLPWIFCHPTCICGPFLSKDALKVNMLLLHNIERRY